MQILKIVTTIFLINVLSGCATGSVIITGQARPAIDPTEVNIFLEPPSSQYETIGIIEASSAVEFSRQAAQDRVINELRSQAAKIGANGIILVSTGNQSGGTTGFFSNGVFYASTSTRITAQGRAIYVIQE